MCGIVLCFKKLSPSAPLRVTLSEIDVFSSHQQSNVETCETVLKHLIEIVLILVTLNVFKGNMLSAQCVNLSCNYGIIFHDSQQRYLKWE